MLQNLILHLRGLLDLSVTDHLHVFPRTQVLAVLIWVPSCPGWHWKASCKHRAGSLCWPIHKLPKSYTYPSRLWPWILYTVGHLLSPSSISNHIHCSTTAETEGRRTPIHWPPCLSLVMDGSDCVFHAELLSSWGLCWKRTGLLLEQFLEKDGERWFPAGSLSQPFRHPLDPFWRSGPGLGTR